jgi:sodium-dependent dicarboxylate transporter 2/3/5
VLILFGGGLALAAAFSSSGLATWLGSNLVLLNAMGPLMLVLGATTLIIFLTEMTSNLATTATFLPVGSAIALQVGIDPVLLLVPIALAASCAFMLPVATPPNAIIFASGHITIPQMMKAGVALNVVGMLLVTTVGYYWVPLMLNL